MRIRTIFAILFLLLPANVFAAKNSFSWEMPRPRAVDAINVEEVSPPDPPEPSTTIFYGALTNDNSWTASQRFKGPDPWHDIVAYGARSYTGGGFPTTTTAVSNGCVASSTTVNLVGTLNLVNGQGIQLQNCGPTSTLSAPSAPSVSSGLSYGAAVPESYLYAKTGSSTYNYKLIADDGQGGVSAAGSATTITNGLASLGVQSMAIVSSSLTGNTLTVTVADTTPLVNYTVIDMQGGTNAALSGMYNEITIQNGTTFTIPDAAITSNYATVTSTGGTLWWWQGEQLIWTESSGTTPYRYWVCGERPGDSSYHILGWSYPEISGGDANGDAGHLTWTDWGATVTTAPVLPYYVSDASCANASPTNDYLSTTVVSGAGTTSIVVANAPSNNSNGSTVSWDNWPALKACLNDLLHTDYYGNYCFIPPTGSNENFIFSSLVDGSMGLGWGNTATKVIQSGWITLYDGMIGTNYWEGIGASNPNIDCKVAVPCIFLGGGGPTLTGVSLDTYLNQYVGILWDTQGNDDFFGSVHKISITDANSTDLSGIPIVIRPGHFVYKMYDIFTWPGPGGNNTHTTMTPAIWFAFGSNASTHYSSALLFDNIFCYYRCLYGPWIQGTNVYMQSGIMPTSVWHNPAGTLLGGTIKNFTDDSAVLQDVVMIGSAPVPELHYDQVQPLSSETGGPPPSITGIMPLRAYLTGVEYTGGGAYASSFPYIGTNNTSITYTNSFLESITFPPNVGTATNFGTAVSSTQLYLGYIQAPMTSEAIPGYALYTLQSYIEQVTAGVSCGAGSNTAAVTVTWTTPEGTAGTYTFPTLTISANGLAGNFGVSSPIVILANPTTKLYYSVATTLASAGCSPVPQYRAWVQITK